MAHTTQSTDITYPDAKQYFYSQYQQIKDNAVDSTVSILRFKNAKLRQHLMTELSKDSMRQNDSGLMGNPVFEVLFPWQGQGKTMAQFGGDLLHKDVANMLVDSIPVPYKHQARAWEILNDEDSVNSLIVTSGTGSGKTECFMVPILDDLVKQQEKKVERLTGVRALFLYPLNALINSQRERLGEWTQALGDDIRFSLYNGDTPNTVPKKTQNGTNEVLSRENLRKDSPPILVTNATMLEYMLIRQKDAPIIQQSQKKLRWIVLDEAHSYTGSTAAELSLLLRRVMLAFDVNPSEVHFVATSATIGDDAASISKLKDFLAKLAGVNRQQIHIITAKREVTPLAVEATYHDKTLTLEALINIDASSTVSAARYKALTQHPFAQRIRSSFVKVNGQGNITTVPNQLQALYQQLQQDIERLTAQQSDIDPTRYLLQWLDICANTQADEDDPAFLPIRGHFFQRTLSGLYSCVNADCQGKKNSALAGNDTDKNPVWDFGYLYTSHRSHCKHCEFPVYEVSYCQECQTPHLLFQSNMVRGSQLTFNTGVKAEPKDNSEVNLKETTNDSNRPYEKLVPFNWYQEGEFTIEDDDIDSNVDSNDSANHDDNVAASADFFPKLLLPQWRSQQELADKQFDSKGKIVKASAQNKGVDTLEAHHAFELACIDKQGIKRVLRQDLAADTNSVPQGRATIAIKEAVQGLNSMQYCYFCEAKSKHRPVIKTVNLGAPFYMSAAAPLLLEHCKAYPKNADSKPFLGKRMITFTDSRQGTARITMKLRQDSERRSLRHIVYYSLAQQLDTDVLNAEELAQKHEKIKAFQEQQDQLLELGVSTDMIDLVKAKITALQKECANEPVSPVLAWRDLVKKITDHPEFTFLSRSVAKIAEINHITDNYGKAELLLLNEIAYRPRNANSLETMGLMALSYPKIKEIDINNFAEWQSLGLTQQDWHDYLHLLLDFYVREYRAIEISENQIKSLTTRFFGYKQLIPADANLSLSPQDAKKTQKWLQVNADRPNSSMRLIRLFAVATGLDLTQLAHQDKINLILKRAFADLTQHNILTSKPLSGSIQAYQLDFNKVSLSIPINVWVCPVTRRFLSSTFKQLTPYLPRHTNVTMLRNNMDEYLCSPVKMPIFKPTPGVLRFKEEAKQWLDTNDTIQTLRQDNLWSDVASDVILDNGIIVTEEHSAQIDSATLKQYEAQFKDGKVNILNCSTTMEMGVDIGGISSVAMNNVPPHPANYLQRTGRAGRSRESAATAFTLCKDNPHEQMVFNNTNWAFTTKIAPPYIILNSAKIVQRHINAYLLAHYLPIIMPQNTSAITLNSGWFFFGFTEVKFDDIKAYVETISKRLLEEVLTQVSSIIEYDKEKLFEVIIQRLKENAPIEKMIDELNSLKLQTESKKNPSKIRHDIEAIKASKALGTKSFTDVVESSISDLKAAQRLINEKVARRIEEYMSFDNTKGRSSSYLSKLIFDICSATASYLLSDLARYSFLPRYGFPTGLIEFDIYSKHVKPPTSKNSTYNNSRIDNLTVRGSKPVRDIAIAIREYAPGNEVVIDGLVYESAGIELSRYYNHSKAHDAQIISKFAYCNKCGAMGVYLDLNSKLICTTCQHIIPERNATRYVEPMGFKVDYFATPHNSIEHQSYVPVQEPAIQASTKDRLPLISPDIGFYRIDAEGLVFHRSSGTYGFGYFICLGCGRAESSRHHSESLRFEAQRSNFLKHVPMKPLSKTDILPEDMKSGACDAEGRGHLVQHLHLGAKDTTNVIEIYLKRPIAESNNLKNDLGNGSTQTYFDSNEDSVTLHTLAVALRDSLAQCHGINAEELGFGIKEVRHDNEEVGTISIYDKASGGAGFSATADQYFDDMFNNLTQILNCVDNCDSACHSCLLTYDTRFISDKLNRHQGLAYLQSIKNNLALPEAAKRLLPQARHCRVDIATRVGQKLAAGYDSIRLYLQGLPTEWAVAEILMDKVLHWQYNQVSIEIAINKDTISRLDDVTKLQLGHLNALNNVAVVSFDSNSDPLTANYLLQMHCRQDSDKIDNGEVGDSKIGRVFTMATTDKMAYVPNADYWEVGTDNPKDIVVETTVVRLAPVQAIADSMLYPASDHDFKSINITDELDVAINGFGDRFWQVMQDYPVLLQKIGALEDIIKIEYSDPYVRSPLTTLLLAQVLYALKTTYDQEWAHPDVIVKTSYKYSDKNKYSKKLSQNWSSSTSQERVQQKFFSDLGFKANIMTYDIKKLPHHRFLKIHWLDKSVTTLSLDQGFGFMQSNEGYNFNNDIIEQVKELHRLMDAYFVVRAVNNKVHKTYIGHADAG